MNESQRDREFDELVTAMERDRTLVKKLAPKAMDLIREDLKRIEEMISHLEQKRTRP